MRRATVSVLASVLVLVGGLLVTNPSSGLANASSGAAQLSAFEQARAAAGCVGQSCNGKNPQVQGCDVAPYAYTIYSKSYSYFDSKIELRYSVLCEAYWARFSAEDDYPNCGSPAIALQNASRRADGSFAVQNSLERTGNDCYFWTGMLNGVNRWGRVRFGIQCCTGVIDWYAWQPWAKGQ